MANFLFELLIEDMPHGVLPNTAKYLKDTLPALLEKHGLSYKEISYFVTPRRLAFHISDLPEKGLDRVIEQKGPSVKVAYDVDGNPTQALAGFFNTYNVTQSDIEEREIKGQKYIFIKKIEIGSDLKELLQLVIQELIKGIKFPQPMRWNHEGNVYEFIRPVRGVVALIDTDVLSINLFGIESSNVLYGHRQLFPQPFVLECADNYENLLKQHGVICSFEERTQMITDTIESIASTLNGRALLDGELLSILASLTENPHPILAEFDKSFLELPKEVLISEMKVHQKYVPLVDSKGKLLPNYIITANIPCQDEEVYKNVLKGNDRVLRARFADGRFFFDEDMKKGLHHYSNQLSSVAFVDNAGSMGDKVNRMKEIALCLRNFLALHIDADELLEAVTLCKSDLSSLMVGEFPELQGVIGYYYALQQGISPSIALSIKEHYYPMNVDGNNVNPTQELSALVGLADRFDNLLTLYAVGKTVSGSRDPYALRRQTIAIIHLLRQYNWEQFTLEFLFSKLENLYKPLLMIDQQEWQTSITEFIKTRLEGILKAENYHTDILNATLSRGVDAILLDIDRVKALQEIQQEYPEPFLRLVELYKRISNILKDQQISTVDERVLVEEAEKSLYNKYRSIDTELTLLSPKEGLLGLVNLEGEITQFFDNVTIKTGDEKEKNRLSLLHNIQQLFIQYADFSKISS